ncbi:CaiB/BaiF CoA-transferase family protein [Cryptosporangium aurantiacum]|uniref:Crotonobetainyl-CoA:carnitine CoA-transferase CaiB n=1 Tax=Cryptosporangium aurantiacum TaxID=134849 RepID=A0A1M7PJJ5_9ACTN|nr:CoA transferase [Cryptosporangium aurantiacum]SHN17369.1 Crotonobetainyl-CoA:carnitine CoA-transferase CaiB [Cryptosporangium aurantiacum]
MSGDLDLPLDGVRVVDLTIGPLAAIGRHLVEWGAEVIRVEKPGGADDRRSGRSIEGVSLDFVAANLGKKAIELDLGGDAGDWDAFEELLAGTDILLESSAPLDVDALHRRHPGLVILSVSPFGRSGSYSNWQATGPVFHALSGELSRSGIPGRPPLLPPGNLPYDCAVPQAVYVTLLAYLERLRTGVGDHLDFAVLDGAVHALDPGYGIAGSATAGVPASKLPRGRPDARHQYPIIPCADGFVRLCILSPRQWRGMFAWMGSPEEFADPSFDRLDIRFKSPTLIPAITRFFADQKRADLEEAGQRHGVPTTAVLDLREALESEQIQARRAFTTVDLAPGIAAPFPDGVLEFDGYRAGIRGPAPLPDHRLPGSRPPVPADDPSGDPSGRPLAGLRVLDLGVIVVGAEQSRLLADQGADVIKVENDAFRDGSRQTRDGSVMSVTFAAGHRNKRSLGLDLRSEAGRELFLRLAAETDVVLTNFRPGTLESLGLGYDVLKAANPGVIVVDSSAFGSTGPASRRLGYGPLVRASAGLTRQWRYPDDEAGYSDAITVYPDHVAARIGVAGVLALLVRRRRTGAGGTISISQTEVMLGHMASKIAEDSLTRAGHVLDGPETPDAPWGVFPAAGDDEWCVVTVRSDGDRRALCRVIGHDDSAADQGLVAALTEWLAARTAADAMETLQNAGVPAAAMLRVSELPSFPYYIERNFFRTTGHPAVRQPFHLENAPVRSERLPDPDERPAPLLGEHTRQIAAERLGLTDAEIDTLLTAGVLQA